MTVAWASRARPFSSRRPKATASASKAQAQMPLGASVVTSTSVISVQASWAARPFGLDPLASAALVAVYVLGVMFFTAQGGLKAALSPNHLQAGRIELVFTNARPQRNRPVAGPDPLVAGSPGADPARAAGGGSGAAPGESFYADRISKQCALLQAHFKLTNREAQIVEAVARGNTVGAIAEQLGVSENTVRTHTKRLYTTLDIHKKRQLVELVGTFDANALNAGEGR